MYFTPWFHSDFLNAFMLTSNGNPLTLCVAPPWHYCYVWKVQRVTWSQGELYDCDDALKLNLVSLLMCGFLQNTWKNSQATYTLSWRWDGYLNISYTDRSERLLQHNSMFVAAWVDLEVKTHLSINRGSQSFCSLFCKHCRSIFLICKIFFQYLCGFI